ncbi:ABC transporter permease [Arthrobacter sp. APC 3897]|uniref:ABC transporter permease n=1 Tax=Arthrobacter sp. APC 3897 TaxID=3035204 RepID=UPI0025B3A229|nr:ABC transporter permease [Arthrobacter sp. APC 3897]MDN3482868.1 ABC transporter permease [Arthrobacter sp. APC 3897]
MTHRLDPDGRPATVEAATRDLPACDSPSTPDLIQPVPAADRFNFIDLLIEATSDLGTRPGRLLMTLAGTILGIGALVATVGFAQTTAEQLAKRFDAFAATQIIASPAQAQNADGNSVATSTLPWDSVQRIERLAGIDQAALITEVELREGTVTAVPVNDPSAPTSAPPRVFATSAGIIDTLEGTIRHGRIFDEGHDLRHDRVAMLGERLAERLGITRIDSQPSIFIDGLPYAVVGVFSDVQQRTELLDSVVISTGAAQTDFGLTSSGELQARIVIGAGPQIAEQAALALAPDAPNSVDITAPKGRSELAENVQADVNLIFVALSVVVLLAGGVGIANVTMLSVMERTGEIGLRRAIGATRQQIAAQFITESVIIGLLGGLIGATAGVFTVIAISLSQQWTPVINPLIAIGGALLGALVGLTAGSFPARKATGIEPVAALRGT